VGSPASTASICDQMWWSKRGLTHTPPRDNWKKLQKICQNMAGFNSKSIIYQFSVRISIFSPDFCTLPMYVAST
jgi:hypothetical protein